MARKKTTGPTDRELAILGVLWKRGPSTVRQVHETLHSEAETGYTTTLKLMQTSTSRPSPRNERRSRWSAICWRRSLPDRPRSWSCARSRPKRSRRRN